MANAHSKRSPKSAALNEKAVQHLVDGGSHAIRLLQPFPPRIVSANGGWFKDEDGHDVLDFWQGHMGNIMGHNPEVVTSTLAGAFGEGFGLQTGFADRLQIEVAEILCRRTQAERVRLTTSGSLATMYALLLARAFTRRSIVMKVGGGWHGAQPWGLVGVGFRAGDGEGYQHEDSAGLSSAVTDEVLVTRFNDPDMLRDQFRQHGDRVACFIVEPFLGAGGLVAATVEYLETARQLTEQYGALLIFDEVITGFRFRAGDIGTLYGLRPDLATFGKIIGGGMPLAAVGGRTDVMEMAGRDGGSKVAFFGGTYSAHPSSMLAAKTAMSYLIEHEKELYSRLAESGAAMRQTLETAFAEEGIYVRCTGYGNEVLPGTSLAMANFPYRDDVQLDRPDVVFDPGVCDVALSQQVLGLALLLEDVHIIHAHGALCTEHTGDDIRFLDQACRQVARRVAKYLK